MAENANGRVNDDETKRIETCLACGIFYVYVETDSYVRRYTHVSQIRPLD